MAWIYHNATLWLISLSSDGSNWITIADKNLWATQVRNDGDTVSEANAWKFYQWGNNYWFPATWPTTTSSTVVDAGTYWPWNYYSSSTFITGSYWDSSYNRNLWGEVTWTYEAKQWPCPSWYHIPSISEWNTLKNIITSLWISNNVNKLLKVPILWYIYTDWRFISNTVTYIWSSDIDTSYPNSYSRFIDIRSNQIYTGGSQNRTYGFEIRPFKNEPVVPDYNDTWETLYWDELPDRPLPPLPKIKWLQNLWNYYYFKEAPTHASAITLNKNSITLTEAWQTEQLVATITPSDAVDKKVIWSSSNTSIATVSSTGLVTCVTPGSATITATCADGWASASCSVKTIVYINYILVWWWWGWWWWEQWPTTRAWWWGGWWEVLYWNMEVNNTSYNITIWAWWCWWKCWCCTNCPSSDPYRCNANWDNWWDTTFWSLTARWWKWWWFSIKCTADWWASWSWCAWWWYIYQLSYISWWWGWWAWWRCTHLAWYNATNYWWWWGWWGANYCGNFSLQLWWNWCQWVVIVCYKTWDICATGWTITTSWNYTVHTFTSNWTFCIVS